MNFPSQESCEYCGEAKRRCQTQHVWDSYLEQYHRLPNAICSKSRRDTVGDGGVLLLPDTEKTD